MEKLLVEGKNLTDAGIEKAVAILAQGGVIAFPTETVYGIAARADKDIAVNRLYSLKGQRQDKPFSIALGDPRLALSRYFLPLDPFGYKLVENFWPGPLTIVYYQKEEADKKIGIRIPDHFIASQILKRIDFPIFLPSANRSNQKEALAGSEVEAIFGSSIDLIIDAGKVEHKKPSTVVDLTYKPFKILREGAVSEQEIAAIFITKRILFVCTGNSCRSPIAEYLLREYLKREKGALAQRYQIFSAGIAANQGASPSSKSQKIMSEYEGIDMSGFKATQITRQMILSSDYIFAMEDFQVESIINKVPSAKARVFNLKKLLPSGSDYIPDPIGQSTAFYQDVYQIIKKSVLELVEWL